MRSPPLAPSLMLVAALVAGGCRNTLYATTGDVMAGYTVEHVLPSMMASGDVALACNTGMAFASFLMSFGRVTEEPRRAGLVTFLSAGMCAEALANEAELDGLRAVHEGRAAAARDARIVEKRHRATAARRYLAAYRHAEAALGPFEETCPDIAPEDEVLFLLGLAAGANAVLQDRAAQGESGVPLDIPRAVARAATCLDAAAWWGAPDAVRAAVWTGIPGAAPEGVDPWAVLDAAAGHGDAAGVRLARALAIQSAAAQGDVGRVREGLRLLARSVAERPADPDWRLIDAMAVGIARHESDEIWTQATGHRTPLGSLGTFPDQPPDEVDDSVLDDLEGLDGAEESRPDDGGDPS